MATQAECRSVTRERLLEGAVEVLVSSGAAGFTTTEVATRSGLSQGAIFKHFPTKAALLSATAEYIFSGLVVRYEGERMPEALPGTDNLNERLSDAIDLDVATMQGRVIQRLATPSPETDRRVLALLHRLFAEHLADLTGQQEMRS